jgi:hypothetical protein
METRSKDSTEEEAVEAPKKNKQCEQNYNVSKSSRVVDTSVARWPRPITIDESSIYNNTNSSN